MPKPVDEWGLDRKSLKIVKRQLKLWLKLFYKQANYRTGTVYRADAIKNDYFFFTDCRDLVSKEVESRGQEHSKKIRKRKRSVYGQLIIKNLLGKVDRIITPCNHCGYPEVFVNGVDGGHYDICPKCFKTVIVTYPNFYSTCVPDVIDDAIKHDILKLKEKEKK